MRADLLHFPTAFTWGAATSSYQIEGAPAEDGKGESIWDRFCRIPGKVLNSETGDVACDHYHRYREDVRLMSQIGIQAYRFSIAWPRIFPQGRGAVNQLGLDFYDRLVDRLLDVGIQPFATLYHWDLPQALQEKGGWVNRDTINYFAEYAAVVSKRLGNRVVHWITHNEPWVVAFLGHGAGVHAPGVKNLSTALQVAHHLLLSHGEAVKVLKGSGDEKTQVGIALNLSPTHPASEGAEDQKAARRFDGYLNRWFLDPIFRGTYPEDMVVWYGDKAPLIQAGDLDHISVKADFLGVNYYTRGVIKADPKGGFLQTGSVKPEGSEYTETDREIYPEGIYELLKHLHDEYDIPRLYVTENGADFVDEISEDGAVRDPCRIRYIHEHLVQAYKAIQDGVNLTGYFVWSLMDNFEWTLGYSKRFGLIYVDYATGERITKESGRWYREVIEKNGVMRQVAENG